MNVSELFRQGFGPGLLRPGQQFYQPHLQSMPPQNHDNDDHEAPSRIAHTLTACCRCRQRKTRCDPTLPRCLPCERSGSVCEYYDSTKGRKISRFYVVKLQEKVRQLEAELAQFTEEDLPEDPEDKIRPGGLVRLSESDETPRYLGPSSGIAMTRLLMDEAKRYTETQRISELIPELKARRIERLNRMQSMSGPGSGRASLSASSFRKKSYPMISAVPAQSLPSRPIVDKLVEVFNSRGQVFTPALHERVFATHLNEVFDGSTDAYKNFAVRMVMAISLQKLDTQYAGLADSYYLSAMEYFEEVVRPKDLRTLQCLALIGQYSLLTPTRTNVYHIVGLATRICQQLSIADEKTISSGFQVDPLTLDMRRRLSWIVATMELGLAHSMGRPNGFSKGSDLIDVGFFADVDDEYITENGIQPGPPSEKKRIAIHFCKMRVCQAEIRRVLYEKKRSEPRSEDHPWFIQMEKKVQHWLDSAPEQPTWCRPWFTGRYHTMIVSLYRPSPQVPKPSPAAALRCYQSSAYVTNLGSQQVKKGAIDITWVFLLTIYMSLNTILWSVSYPEVRKEHPREEIEELINTSLDIVDQCSERWPGASAASQLYSIFAKACLQSYDTKEEQPGPPQFSTTQYGAPDNVFHTPSSQVDPNSPSASEASSMPTTASVNSSKPIQGQPQEKQQAPVFNTPQFGYVFSPAEQVAPAPFGFDEPGPGFNQPQFRSGSIFLNPASTEPVGRRFSYFPPEAPPATNNGDASIKEEDTTPPASTMPTYTSSYLAVSPSLATSPDTYATPPGSSNHGTMSPSTTITSTSSATPTPTVRHVSPMPVGLGVEQGMTFPPPIKFESPQTPQSQQGRTSQRHGPPQPISVPPPQSSQRLPQTFINPQAPPPPLPRQAPPQQPLPTPPQRQQSISAGMSNWFSPAPPFIAPYGFSDFGDGAAASSYLSDPSATFTGYGLGGFGGLNSLGTLNSGLSGQPPGGLGLVSGPGLAGFGDQGGNFAGVLGGSGAVADPFGFPSNGRPDPQRQGSLSQEQQMELMDVLETEGMGDIDTFLSMGIGLGGVGAGSGVNNWQQ